MILLSKKVRLRTDQTLQQDLYILGNSPNIQRTLEENTTFFTDKDVLAVNFFWKSNQFSQIKPRIYVISSLSYWAKGKIDSNEADRKRTFSVLAETVTWDMILFVPVQARKHSIWKKQIENNTHISIQYYNLTPIEGLTSINHYLLSHNWGVPRPHNVLIPSITFAINSGYSSIYILGAEHSWLKDIYVSDKNKVYLTQKHFYNEKEAKPEVMYIGTKNQEKTLGEMLMKFMYTFNSYFALKKYAESKHTTIYNATPNSYIDAFERVTIF
ncbi:MAG: hypothetical protein PF481_10880 [Bacteroidales bacterium]|nr:hypothetical protein [Bacteroidales bacterium]